MIQKFYKKTWFILLFLLIFPPIGILLLWANKKFRKTPRIILTIFFAFIFLVVLTPTNNNTLEIDKKPLIENVQKEKESEADNFIDNSEVISEKIVEVSQDLDITRIETAPIPDEDENEVKTTQLEEKTFVEKNNVSDIIKYKGISYKIIEVDGGNLSGKREANVAVNIGYGAREYWAFTNEYGQLVYVTAEKIILQDDFNEPVLSNGRYYRDEAKVPGTELKEYDEGHIIADSLGGVSNAYNITPQESTLNRYGDQAYMEKVIRDAGGCEEFIATITYQNTNTQIPSHYKYEYILKGNKVIDEFENLNPDKANEGINKGNKPEVNETNKDNSKMTEKESTSSKTENKDLILNNKNELVNREAELLRIDTKSNRGVTVTITEAKAAGYKMPIKKGHWLYEYMDDRDGDGIVGE